MSEGAARSESVLASTAWLRDNLRERRLRIVDVRGAVRPAGHTPRYVGHPEQYAAGHIPGAVFVDWTRDIIDPDDTVPVQVAPPALFERVMRKLGIGRDTLVVAYDDHHHIFAGRLAWALRYYGHDAVRILHGGWSKWVAEGGPVSKDDPHPAMGDFVAKPREALRRTADQVFRHLGNSETLLIDARAKEQYSGQASAAARTGHIPGALNVPYAELVDPKTGMFLPPDDLARVFAEAGIDTTSLPSEIVVYCNGGVSCTVPLNALRILGRDDVAVYDGSWNEWGNDPARPIARSAATDQSPKESKRGDATR